MPVTLEQPRRPNLLIIGAQKAGSTWIYDVLKEHPDVFLPERVELTFFNRLECEDPQAIATYLEHFAPAPPGVMWVGEKTPGYFWTTDRDRSATQPPKSHNPDLPASVRRVLGDDLALIVSLRHPVRRAISAYVHHGIRDRVKPAAHLRDVAPSMGILDIGFYSQHLAAWEREFDPERILTLIFESEIKTDPIDAYRRMCARLEIDDGFVPSTLSKVSNQNPPRTIDGNSIDTGVDGLNPVRPSDIRYLLDAYASDIESLRNRFGDRLAAWDADSEVLEAFADQPDPESGPVVTAAPAPRPTILLPSAAPGAPTSLELSREEATHERLRSLGLDLSGAAAKQIGRGFSFEAPARVSNAGFHSAGIGAFSYTTDGHVYATQIGRYCSIARAINIGQTDHPMDWLSTSPVQFRSAFRIATGDEFAFKAEYDADGPTAELEQKAHLAVRARTTIGHDVWIGHGAIVIAGVNVGHGAVIGAGAVVTKDVEPYAVVGGTPARVIKKRFEDAVIERLLASAWWEFAPWQMRHIDFSDISVALDAIDRMRAEGVAPYVPGVVRVTG